METVMKICVILHNMIVEDESIGGSTDPHSYLFDPTCQPGGVAILSVSRPPPFTGLPSVEALIMRSSKLHDKRLHMRLQNDLIEHMWELHGKH